MSTMTQPRVLSATTMIGDTVKNTEGEKLGTIKEIMFDTSTGHIAYAVLDFGGFLGIGNKLFAVPWRALTLRTEEECFEMNVSKEQLERANGFDQDDWPDFADRRWGAELHTYFGTTPYWV